MGRAYPTDLVCDDKNTCTIDSCDPKVGCVYSNTIAPCDDGDACTVGETCAKGSCAGASPKNCNDGNDCTDDACDALQGCTNAGNTKPCDDGDACTKGEVCASAICKGGGVVSCDDNEVCTTDVCDPKAGCLTIDAGAGTPCRDANACASAATCTNGKCGPNPPGDFKDVVLAASPALRIVAVVPTAGDNVGAIAVGGSGTYWYSHGPKGVIGTPTQLQLPTGMTFAAFTQAFRVGADVWLGGVGQSAGKTTSFFVKSNNGTYAKTIVVDPTMATSCSTPIGPGATRSSTPPTRPSARRGPTAAT